MGHDSRSDSRPWNPEAQMIRLIIRWIFGFRGMTRDAWGVAI